MLHHNDPYLRLGPFKLEALHQNPEIAIIHEFASFQEVKKFKDLARGRMKCTPYSIEGRDESGQFFTHPVGFRVFFILLGLDK